MPDNEAVASAIHRRGAEPSLIERFSIDGLYGYRSIELASDYAATILIAKNGSGKTTLLGALDAFLRMQLSRLRNLEFSEIRCKLRGQDDDLVLTHNDVIEFLQVPSDGEIVRLASRASLEPPVLFNFLIDEWTREEDYHYDPSEGKAFSAILSAYNYNRRDAIEAINKARALLMERQPVVSRIFSILTKTLAGSEIVYLPTYRRIELALRGDPREASHRRRRPRFDVAIGSLFTGEIQFGLSDIAERLAEMNQQIIVQSNSGYRKISADIINELIDGSLDNDVAPESDVPSLEELRLFFDRLEQGQRQSRFVPAVSVPNLQKVYTGEGVPDSSSRFLNYFLTKLATVIRSTKDVELSVDGFVGCCNKYLLLQEPSTTVPGQGNDASMRVMDGKALKVNRSNLRVHVESVPDGRRISLDALSSGEKQMISLFAKMFLYPGRKIVLVDEPELSLSIDWQRHILVDVLGPVDKPLLAAARSGRHGPLDTHVATCGALIG